MVVYRYVSYILEFEGWRLVGHLKWLVLKKEKGSDHLT